MLADFAHLRIKFYLDSENAIASRPLGFGEVAGLYVKI